MGIARRYNTIILGAGAAGMMCAAHAGSDTLIVDHAKAPGEKICISGGGRCNFTNLHASPDQFLSQNPHFAKSALARYSQWDFIALVERHKITWHEKTLGQLFCDHSAKEIVAMLQTEMTRAGAELSLQTKVKAVRHADGIFKVTLERDGQDISITARHLVLATGGKSIPKMGASGLAYEIASQFGLGLTETRPALVPLSFPDKRFAPLSGVSLRLRISTPQISFDEAMLFTHRGLSGPAILQISSYWRDGEEIVIDLAPDRDLFSFLKDARQTQGKRQIGTALEAIFPKRLLSEMSAHWALDRRLADQSDVKLERVHLNWFHIQQRRRSCSIPLE